VTYETQKRLLWDLINEALKAADPYEAVRKVLLVDDGAVRVDGVEVSGYSNSYLLAIGKAACKMSRAVMEVLDVKEGLIVTKRGYAGDCPRRKNLTVVEAGHPIPDSNSIKAGKLGLELARKVKKGDLLIVLISGGGSAVFELPDDGISLEDIVRTNDLLLRSGAKIHEVNTVRKHLSRVKGGKLAMEVKGTIISLIVSDVVGDNVEAIASGITAKDPTTFRDAYEVLMKYGVWEELPESVRAHIVKGLEGKVHETLKEELPNVHNVVIAGIGKACEAVARRGEGLGFNTAILTTEMEGEAKDVGLSLGSIAREVALRNRPFNEPALLIAGGETTVTVGKASGKGGPNQELALSATRKIAGLPVILAAFDTDGTDGPTDAAGAIVDGATMKKLGEAGIDVDRALRDHDSYNALDRVGALLKTGPTGTNVNSMVIMMVGSPKVITR